MARLGEIFYVTFLHGIDQTGSASNTLLLNNHKYSQISLRRTPLGPALSVRLMESQIKGVKKVRDQILVSERVDCMRCDTIKIDPICFCWFSCP